MGYLDDDLVMISALSHYSYCPRRCALIHIEQVWTENQFTAEGRIMHERVHEAGNESRGTVRIGRGLPLRSSRLGLVGVADVVEFRKVEKCPWQPYPVEYKRGKPKPDHSDVVQLCAQALCLEEMLSVTVSDGAMFYGRTKRRLDVVFHEDLRRTTEKTVADTRQLILSGITPPPEYSRKCESCSIKRECMPKTIGKHLSVSTYVRKLILDET